MSLDESRSRVIRVARAMHDSYRHFQYMRGNEGKVPEFDDLSDWSRDAYRHAASAAIRAYLEDKGEYREPVKIEIDRNREAVVVAPRVIYPPDRWLA